jgi:hypothetical protein
MTRNRAKAISGSANAEAASAGGELGERLFERHTREVGPQLVAEDELGVGRLPQEVVGEAALSARADDDLGVMHLGGVEELSEVLLLAALEGAGSVEDLRPPAVVESNEKGDAGVGACNALGPAHPLDERIGQTSPAADEAHANAFLVQLRGFLGDAEVEHLHESLNLLGWARPVLGGEGVHGELLHAELRGVAQAGLQVVGARAVTFVDRKVA